MRRNSSSICTKPFIIWVSLLISFPMLSQSLKERIKGKTNFEEITQIAEAYYHNLKVNELKRHPSDPKYKHWKRWEWYHQHRLDSKGNILTSQLPIIAEDKAIKKIEASSSRSTNSDWSFLGPDSHISSTTSTQYIGLGRVDRMAFHPTNSNIIFVGSPAGGLWKTTNGGNTWNPVDDFLPSLGISGIAISPTNPDLMYILTGCGDGFGITNSSGVFKSTNGGETWESTATLSIDTYSAYALEMDPNDDQKLFAATTEGLYRTINGGQYWNKVIDELIYDVKFKPGSSSILYASGVSNMFYTTTSGINLSAWEDSSLYPAPSFTGRTAIAVTADDPNRVYLHMGPNLSDSTFQGFYYSSNSGEDLVRVATSPNIVGGQANYNFCIAASPTQKNIIIVGGLICWRSTNSGTSWNNITTYGSGSNLPGYVHPDIHALAFNPLNNYLYVANDGGFYRSVDNGTTWTNLSDGLATALYYNFAETPLDPNYILGGNQDNGVKLRKSNSTSFDHIAGADGYDVAFSPTNKTKFISSINSGVTRFWNNGANNTPITPRSHWFTQVAIHETNENILFVGTSENGGRLYKSTNQGSSWDTLNILAGDAIITCPSFHNRLYIAGGKNVYRSDNLGDSATPIHNNPGFPDEYTMVSDLAVNPAGSGFVYVTISGTTAGQKVMQSVNSGDSWTNISGGLPNVPTYCIATTASGDLYVGTEIGVFFKAATATDWVPYRNGLPSTRIADLSINESQNTIRAASYGRGIWESPLSNGDCTTNLTWGTSPNLVGYHYFEASNSIVNESEISGGMTTDVFMKSGNYIDLKDGFRAKNDGLTFRAYIGPCSTGGIPNIIIGPTSDGQKKN